MKRLVLLLLVGGMAALCTRPVSASVIHVPADQPTIQAGIDAAVDGDTVLVAPGEYTENLHVVTKGVHVISEGGSGVTTLKPLETRATIISFVECVGSEFSGFTVTGAQSAAGPCIILAGSETRISGSAFLDNSVDMLVISCDSSQVHVDHNLFVRNSGISCVGIWSGSVEILNNTFYANRRGLFDEGGEVVARNNIVSYSWDYGVYGHIEGIEYNDLFENHPNLDGGAVAGVGNISVDPQFLDSAGGVFSLAPPSACIDAGDPDLNYNDPDGTRNDLGAFPAWCNPHTGTADCDSDGVSNASDNCLLVSNPLQEDADGDLIGDACDDCPGSYDPSQTDSDHDGTGDGCDNCPSIVNPDQSDIDLDGRGDLCDNCLSQPNQDQSDGDGDKIGDACDPCPLDRLNDSDGDGHCGNIDNCPAVYNPDQSDPDGDGRGDACDNCPSVVNADQLDTDGDRAGNACDNCTWTPNPSQGDFDSDGIGDQCDNCPSNSNPSQLDTDHDGWGDVCDNCPTVATSMQPDADSDGVGDACDNCVNVPNPDQADSNHNGIGDVCDCRCLCHGDPVCDSAVSDISDIVITISVAFGGGMPVDDPSPYCPRVATDVDCTGQTDLIDVIKVINVAFRGACRAAEYCDPCTQGGP